MAKPKESAPLFEEPEFDEIDYIRSERNRAAVILVIFAIGALSGFLAGYLQLIGYTYLSVLLFFVIAIFLSKILTSMGFKLSKRASHRAINYLLFFAVFLLFWIIFLNPPVHTVSSPQLQSVEVMYDGHYTQISDSGSNIFLINASVSSSSYLVHMSYRYNFTVTGVQYYYGTQTEASVANFHQVGNSLYFNQTVVEANGEYYFIIDWTSPSVAVHTPVEFIIRPP